MTVSAPRPERVATLVPSSSSVTLSEMPVSEPAFFAAGSVLAPGYTVREHLARGASLDVYEVWSQERDCSCVAKVPRPDHVTSEPVRTRLRCEAELLLGLSHPGLVRAYEWCDSPTPALVMETREGETLGHLVERLRRPLGAEDLVELTHQVVSVLRYLHRKGTLHLDLKPSNLIAHAGQCCVIDLSHARPAGPCPVGFGTAEYMSPEQLTGGVVTERSDVYGLAGVLYRAATRMRPFGREERERDSLAMPPLTPLRRRKLPRSFVDWVVAGFEPDPRHRPSLDQIASALAGCI